MPVQVKFNLLLMRRIIVVSGASRGIGRAIVDSLAQNSEILVIALSRDINTLSQHFGQRINIRCVKFDLSLDPEQQLRQSLVDLNEIHGLINNAGHLEKGDFNELSQEAYERCLKVNFLGPIALTSFLYSRLSKGKAHVVNISTMGAFQGSVKFPGLSAYAASKAALCNFTEVFAEEQKLSGIRMNCLCLGSVNTEMLQAAFPGYQATTSPEEMGNFIADFTLNQGSIFNGKIIPVSSTTP